MSLYALKNTIVGVAAVIGAILAHSLDFSNDPARPWIFLVGVLLVININLQFAFGLAMGITYPVAMPPEQKKRNRVLLASWFLFGLMIYGFFNW